VATSPQVGGINQLGAGGIDWIQLGDKGIQLGVGLIACILWAVQAGLERVLDWPVICVSVELKIRAARDVDIGTRRVAIEINCTTGDGSVGREAASEISRVKQAGGTCRSRVNLTHKQRDRPKQ